MLLFHCVRGHSLQWVAHLSGMKPGRFWFIILGPARHPRSSPTLVPRGVMGSIRTRPTRDRTPPWMQSSTVWNFPSRFYVWMVWSTLHDFRCLSIFLFTRFHRMNFIDFQTILCHRTSVDRICGPFERVFSTLCRYFENFRNLFVQRPHICCLPN